MPLDQYVQTPLGATLGQNGFDVITTSGSPSTPSDSARWIALIPADGTVPVINKSGTEMVVGDKPLDGEQIPESGMMGAFSKVDLSSGKVYAYRG